MLKLESGQKFKPKPTTKVDCLLHDVHTTWGALSWLGKLAVEDGLDTTADSRCLLLEPKAT